MILVVNGVRVRLLLGGVPASGLEQGSAASLFPLDAQTRVASPSLSLSPD